MEEVRETIESLVNGWSITKRRNAKTKKKANNKIKTLKRNSLSRILLIFPKLPYVFAK